MRISKGAKRRAAKQAIYKSTPNVGYYFGDSKTQREKLTAVIGKHNATLAAQAQLTDLTELPVLAGYVDPAQAVHRMMRRVIKFYGLKNRYQFNKQPGGRAATEK